MFQNLAKDSKLVILDIGEKVAITEGIVENVSGPRPKDAQPSQVLQALAFGQQQELVVDISVSTPTGQRVFRNIPATAAVDRGGTTIITESSELMDVEVSRLMKHSEEHVAATPWHKKAIPEYCEIRKKLSPEFAHEQARDETIASLQRQYGELKSGMDEILGLLKKEA